MATKSFEQKIDALTSIVEKGFAAVAEDISKLATRHQIPVAVTRASRSSSRSRS